MNDKTVHHLFAADLVAADQTKRQRRARRVSLSAVAKQANRAALDVTRYEVKPDGTVIIHTGEPDTGKQPGNELDEWIAKHGAH
jgi:hypothetical protein